MSSIAAEDATMVKLPWFRRNNPSVQILLSSMCIAFNPGFYLALNLLGAGGGQPSSFRMANITSGVLNGVFAVSSIAAGTILNIFGPRITLLAACTGYPVFNGAMWYFSEKGHMWYPIFSGVYLGFTAGLLWTTSVSMSVGYPEEKHKGRWRAIQWIFNLAGGTIGAAVALGISWNATTSGVPRAVYITFIVLQVFSLGFAALILPPAKLRRCDGTSIARFEQMSTRETIKLTLDALQDWRVLLLIPCMFTPEMLFPFQSTMNAYIFNLRTRTLNSLLNGLIQMPMTYFVAWILDNQRFGARRRRLMIATAFVGTWFTGTYIAQTAWLAAWDFDLTVPGPDIDIHDKAYAGAIVIYLLYAALYGGFQGVVLYTLSTFTNDPRKTAALGGLYVGVLSAGTSVCFGLNATRIPYQNINGALFALTTLCWPILFFIAYKYATDTNYGKEETVTIPIHVRKELGFDEIDMDKRNADEEVVDLAAKGSEKTAVVETTRG
ncbi:uncharacterized protein PV07_09053 [Cladophialophora immunda]|uniref:Major facilitator superfamily (MFS) profile domain-containing protein n=1 Tax=Cladophialophora immunda TaxID=569365 RepID=A0A0D2CQQ3_9EURO|nr:uncharacterized protein PV07_09053 [Cladophialophora immunda]KIW25919.1 hypothetical protein PV07_09053 [Cladophialophora immunda]